MHKPVGFKWVAVEEYIAMSETNGRTYWGIVNEFTDGDEAFTFARLGPDNAVFDDREEAEAALSGIVDEYGNHFYLARVTIEPEDSL